MSTAQPKPKPRPKVGRPKPTMEIVDGNKFMPQEISICAAKILPLIPVIEALIDTDQLPSLNLAEKQKRITLTQNEIQSVETFFSIGIVFITAFGPASLSGFTMHSTYQVALSVVKRHLQLMQDFGIEPYIEQK